uniref:Uncharacterized protein n=1 Tax=Anguilla anguilla TaxID=7936 RepID=A0A0E9T8X2_ANGAN
MPKCSWKRSYASVYDQMYCNRTRWEGVQNAVFLFAHHDRGVLAQCPVSTHLQE